MRKKETSPVRRIETAFAKVLRMLSAYLEGGKKSRRGKEREGGDKLKEKIN